MWIVSGRALIVIYGILLVLATQLTLVFAGCAIKPDANGHVDIPNSWKSIANKAFYGCRGMLTVSIPNSVTKIGWSAFYGCINLQTVSIPDKVTSIADAAFYACEGLKTVSIPDSVTSIGGDAFFRCRSITTLVINTTLVGSTATAFMQTYFYNSPIKNIIIGDSVTSIGDNAFSSCTSLKTVSIPNSVTSIGESAFSRCSSLKTVRIPDSVTNIDNYAFSGCTSLETVSIPDSVTSIGDYAFHQCSSLASVTIPDSVTSIGDAAFFQCSNLTSVTIPHSVMKLGTNAFSDCTNLSYATIHSSFLEFGSGVFYESSLNASDILYNKTLIASGEDKAGVLVALECFGEGANKRCGCKQGYGNGMIQSTLYFNCVPCGVGTTSFTANQGPCHDCSSGRYANQVGMSDCNACEAGKYFDGKGASHESQCDDCSVGKHGPTRGNPCILCPPGAYCPKRGMPSYIKCSVGKYGKTPSQTTCASCPPGRYQNVTGQAFCAACKLGTHSTVTGAVSEETCNPCKAGEYGDKEGMGTCTTCPTGQYQPNTGKTKCMECTAIDKLKTNNAERTGCIDNKALLSSSVVQIIFTKGVALYLSFAIMGAFVGLAGAMHFLKTKYDSSSSGLGGEAMAHLELRQVVLKSALPGFSFGSEIFLIIGILSETPALGAFMLTFRLLHPVAVSVLCLGWFFPRVITGSEYLRGMMQDFALHREFMKSNIPLVGVMLLACLADVTMIQLMPFKQSQFYTESKGFPSLDILKFCLGVKTVQTFVSVVCQLIYVIANSDLKDPTMSTQAKALFGLSIAFSMASLVMGLLMFFLQSTLLGQDENKEEEQEEGVIRPDEVELGNRHATELQHITYTGNPMLAAGATTYNGDTRHVSGVARGVGGEGGGNPSQDEVVDTIREENARLNEENDHLRERVEQQGLEIARLELERETNEGARADDDASAIDVPSLRAIMPQKGEQGTSAPPLSAPPPPPRLPQLHQQSSEDGTEPETRRLAGFASVAQKRNSLERPLSRFKNPGAGT